MIDAIVGGRYRVSRHVGGGGMAQVYLAKDEQTGNQVAVKILNTEQMRKPRSLERFRRESRLLCKLRHPNLVKGLESGQYEGRPYIVMEYVDGPNIGELIEKRGHLHADEALKLLLDVALGLDHLFVSGAIRAHRDIKPGNILVTHSGTAKITDFGIAKALTEDEAMTMTSSFLGSPNYMAPEQILDPRNADIRADVYALGAVFYEMLTGEKAYTGKSTKEILDSHFELEAPQVDAKTPTQELCNRVLNMTLAHEVHDRYQTPRALIEAILPVMGADVEISMPRFSVGAVRTAAAVVGGALALSLVIGGLTYLRATMAVENPVEAEKTGYQPRNPAKPPGGGTSRSNIETAEPGGAEVKIEKTKPTGDVDTRGTATGNLFD